MDQEKDPSREEQAEAEALARALDAPSAGQAPKDALETAALLRFGRDGQRPEPDHDAVLARLSPVLERRHRRVSRLGMLWKFWVPAAGLAAATIVALILWLPGSNPIPARLPRPNIELLQTQGQLLRAPEAEPEAFQNQMHSYRQEILAALVARYREER